jgi:hypothetical protein
MPYIKPENRNKYTSSINNLVNLLTNDGCEADVGEINYVISSVIWKLFKNKRRYKTGNDLMGVLECVKQEFYRRQLAELENEKIKENGDIL